MKIAFVSTLAHGGAAQGLENTYQAFLAAGHEASLLTLNDGRAKGFVPLSPDIESDQERRATGMLFEHWLSLTDPDRMRQGASELFSDATTGLFRLSEEARAILRRAEAVNIHWHAGILFAPSLIEALHGRKVVLTLPDMAPLTGGCHYHLTCRGFERECGDCPCLKVPGPDDLSRRNFDIKRRVYALLRPSVVTLSRWLADEVRKSALLRQRPTTNLIYTYDLNSFRPLRPEERQAVRRRLGISANALVILAGAHAVGNDRKNIAALVRVLERIRSDHPDRRFELLLYGYGVPVEADFPVRNAGYVDNRNMWEIYGAADLFVHPAVAEALGNTLCEAQCCGLPVMSFDVGGCPETYDPGVTGICVPEVSAEALHEALLDVILHPENLEPMRRASRKAAMARFSPKRHVKAYLDVIEAMEETALSLDHDPGLSSLLDRRAAESRVLFADKTQDVFLAKLTEGYGHVGAGQQEIIRQGQRLAAHEKTIETLLRLQARRGGTTEDGD